MKTLFLESVAGIAGDMFAASFVDAGLVTVEELAAIPHQLGLDGVYLEVTRPLRAAVQTTHIDVKWQNENWKTTIGLAHDHGARHPSVERAHGHRLGDGGHWHAHHADIERLLRRSKLASPVVEFACAVFHNLAEAEAASHGLALSDVTFHEVGAVDSVVDVAMAAYCVTKVGATRVLATPVKLGRGTVKIDHGTHPVPPPASARLVIGMPVAGVPAAIMRENVELSTPTGLAILRALHPHFVEGVPRGTILAQGMGSGTMDLGTYPNVFRVMLVDEQHAEMGAAGLPFEHEMLVELACNVDDETAERTAWIIEALLGAGALDAWVTPINGKKGRAGHLLTALAEVSKRAELTDWLLRHSSTFGVRYHYCERFKLARKIETRPTSEGDVRFKIGMTVTGEVIKEKPEYEDLRRIWEQNPDFRP